MKLNYLTIMNDEVIICESCGILVDRNKYVRHVRYGHKDKKENVCSLCQKKFTSKFFI